jgi:hypothetical protein
MHGCGELADLVDGVDGLLRSVTDLYCCPYSSVELLCHDVKPISTRRSRDNSSDERSDERQLGDRVGKR